MLGSSEKSGPGLGEMVDKRVVSSRKSFGLANYPLLREFLAEFAATFVLVVII